MLTSHPSARHCPPGLLEPRCLQAEGVLRVPGHLRAGPHCLPSPGCLGPPQLSFSPDTRKLNLAGDQRRGPGVLPRGQGVDPSWLPLPCEAAVRPSLTPPPSSHAQDCDPATGAQPHPPGHSPQGASTKGHHLTGAVTRSRVPASSGCLEAKRERPRGCRLSSSRSRLCRPRLALGSARVPAPALGPAPASL